MHKVQAVPVWGELNAAKRKSSIIINGSGKAKNPKITALVNEIINDGGSETSPSTTQFPEKVLSSPSPHAMNELFPQAVNTKPRTNGDIIGFSDGESDEDDDDDDDDDDDADEQSTNEETEGENEEDDIDSIDDIKPKGGDMEMEIEEFTLPETIEGVRGLMSSMWNS